MPHMQLLAPIAPDRSDVAYRRAYIWWWSIYHIRRLLPILILTLTNLRFGVEIMYGVWFGSVVWTRFTRSEGVVTAVSYSQSGQDSFTRKPETLATGRRTTKKYVNPITSPYSRLMPSPLPLSEGQTSITSVLRCIVASTIRVVEPLEIWVLLVPFFLRLNTCKGLKRAQYILSSSNWGPDQIRNP